MNLDRVMWKISVAGLSRSGKSTLISRLVYDTDDVSMQVKLLNRKRITINNGSGKINADLLLQEVSESLEADRLLPGSAAIIVTVDITNPNSLGYAEEIVKYSANFEKKPLVLVAATKLDLKYEAAIWKDELEKIRKKYGTDYFILSAKTGEGVESALGYIEDSLTKRFYAKRKQTA